MVKYFSLSSRHSNKSSKRKTRKFSLGGGIVIYKSRTKSKKSHVNSPRNQYASYSLFNRYDRAGRELCRNIECDNLSTGKLHYCSYQCKKKFYKYHRMNFTWQGVRFKVFIRDKWRCQLCNVKTDRPQADHIRAVALMKEFGYKDMTLNTYKNYIYSLDNLRTLCTECHKKVTKDLIQNLDKYKQMIRNKKTQLFGDPDTQIII